MKKNNARAKLKKELKKIINKMRKIQQKLAADEQPPSMHELDALTKLGVRYGEIVIALKAVKKADEKPDTL